jgi:peptide/nickel transport system substrate-binding protein
VPDAVTALQLYARGEVDVLGPYAAIEFARRAAAARRGSSVTGDRGATWVGLFLNVKTPELSDVRVRRAIALAFDREAIAEVLVREQGALWDAPSAGDAARLSAPFARYRQDTVEAARLLDAAGWSEPSSGGGTRRKAGLELSVTLAATDSDELSQRILRALNTQASGIGVDLNLVSMDYARLTGDWAPGPRFAAGLFVLRDPPGGGLRARFGIPGPENVSRLSDKALAGLLDAADRTLDDASAAVDAPSMRIADLVPVIPLYQLEVTLAARAGVREVEANASADGFLWNAAEWWIEGAGTPSGSPSPTGT